MNESWMSPYMDKHSSIQTKMFAPRSDPQRRRDSIDVLDLGGFVFPEGDFSSQGQKAFTDTRLN